MHSARRLAFLLVLTFIAISAAAEKSPLYSAQCASCHGADGRGKTAPAAKMEMPDLRSKRIQELTDSDLYETIARGAKHKNYPHAYLYRGMKEKDIRELVQYIRTFSNTTAK